MTGRDLAWRGAGAALCAVAGGLGAAKHFTAALAPWSTTFGCLGLLLSLIGIGLLVQGDRVAAPLHTDIATAARERLPRRGLRLVDRRFR